MHEVGEKFIVEIAERYDAAASIGSEKEVIQAPALLYRIRGFNSLVFDEKGLSKLEKYDENAEGGYDKGLQDAWECSRKLHTYSPKQMEEIFAEKYPEVFEEYTPQEVIEMIKVWEKKKEIRVGDVVKYKALGEFLVTSIYEDKFEGIKVPSGETVVDKEISECKKTGKHVDLTEVFKGLEGENV